MANKCKTGQYYDKKLKKCVDEYDRKESKEAGTVAGAVVAGAAYMRAMKGKAKPSGAAASMVAGALVGRYRAAKKYGKKKKK